jgi:hypothetical protein
MMLHCLHSAILTTGRTTHGPTTSALPGIIAARSLQPSVAGFYGPGVYLSSRTKAVAWARLPAATAGRQFVASDRDSYEMEWRNLDRVHKQQERLPEGRVHVIGRGYIPNSNFADEPGARPVLVAVDVWLGKCKTFDAVLRDADYFYWSFHGVYRGGEFIPALRERDARLRGGGPYCPFHTGITRIMTVCPGPTNARLPNTALKSALDSQPHWQLGARRQPGGKGTSPGPGCWRLSREPARAQGAFGADFKYPASRKRP